MEMLLDISIYKELNPLQPPFESFSFIVSMQKATLLIQVRIIDHLKNLSKSDFNWFRSSQIK